MDIPEAFKFGIATTILVIIMIAWSSQDDQGLTAGQVVFPVLFAWGFGWLYLRGIRQ